ncbi:arsenate reductase ArsC [Methylocucumis oryzae]|uniref:ArsC family transcriptional regulator n=1 Tax=Methylocucumis oryzae TaxID=1632867 RepID=A0A0F3IHR5_9GAMM|nr:arsenate reductase ArsC [Methylocucumis oryzae]KJV06291.1 ArsC family transcriptional regulator [Methylocucumis oryzae]
MYNVLILCTGNSCRSILAEALLNAKAAGRLTAYSAGSHPTGTVNPNALATLARNGLTTSGFLSQSWDDFSDKAIDWVITVCDNAAGETCPVFLNDSVKAHWGLPDPAKVTGTETVITEAFQATYDALAERVDMLLALPFETYSREDLVEQLNQIGTQAELKGCVIV